MQAALANSTKDGDHAVHAGILGQLRSRATSVWQAQVIRAIPVIS